MLKQNIANNHFKVLEIYHQFSAKKIEPLGCSETNAFLLLSPRPDVYELAMMKFSDCTAQDPFTAYENEEAVKYQWIKHPNSFKNFMHACVYKDMVCIILVNQIFILNQEWEVLYKTNTVAFKKVWCCAMNDQYLIISYSTKQDENEFIIYRWDVRILQPVVCKRGVPALSACVLFPEENVVLFTIDYPGPIQFSVYKIDMDTGSKPPYFFIPYHEKPVVVDTSFDTVVRFIKALDDSKMVVLGINDVMFVYKDHQFNFMFDGLEYEIIDVLYVKSADILVAHDAKNNLHFYNFGTQTLFTDHMCSSTPSRPTCSSSSSYDLEDDNNSGSVYSIDMPNHDQVEPLGIFKSEDIMEPVTILGDIVPLIAQPYNSLQLKDDHTILLFIQEGVFVISF